jgi:TetR/AcrR family transcriptional regulator, regulator of autoinduction and epiphytic fitness
MHEPVKGSPGRRERKALVTRRRVLDAAEKLFTRDGYTVTTVIAIAEAADVAVQTVYAIFGSKRAILKELLRVRVGGDDAAIPLRDRQYWQAVEHETDPGLQLALLASVATQIGGRIGALYEVMAAASGSDPEIAEMYQRQQQARYQDQRRLAQVLSRKGALRAGLSATAATDIMWTLASPRTYRSLVGERQWATEEYERWLAHMLASALLPEPSTRQGSP